jgi:hypothetical protein
MNEIQPLRVDNGAIPQHIAKLKKHLGADITQLLLGADKTTINRWQREAETPTDDQKRIILSASNILSLLTSYLPIQETKLWLVDHSEYLYGVPVTELRSRPLDVYLAALNRVTRGEYYEVLGKQMSVLSADRHETPDADTGDSESSENP